MQLAVPTRITRLHVVIVSLFIFIATIMTFVNAVNADFVNWDDDAYVTDNPHVQHLTAESVGWIFSHAYYYSWIPLTLVSHAADIALWGMNPRGHHLTNVVLHAFNAVWFFGVCLLVFTVSSKAEETSTSSSLLERLSMSIVLGSAIGAFLYAMHPLRVESVAWVSGRKDLLCAFFLFPAFTSYLLWKVKRRDMALLAAHLFFALALLSKPMAASFPIILVLVDSWWVKKHSARITIVDLLIEGKTLLFLMSAIVVLVTMLSATGGRVNVLGELNLVERFLVPPYAILFYLWKIVAPFDLSPIYPDLNLVMLYLSPVVFIAIFYLSFVLIEKKRAGVALALLTYIVMLLPTFMGLSSGMQPLADRYTYLATISLFMLVGGSVEWLWRKSGASSGRLYQRELIFAVLFVLCGINAYRTIRHVGVWNASIPLWSQAVRSAPATRGEFESRKPYLKPNYLDAHINLGAAYYAANDKPKAIEQFNTVLLLDNHNADAHYNLGNVLFETGDVDGSMQAFKNTIANDKSYAKAYYNLGILYAKRDSVEAAVSSFRMAARLGYSDAQTLLNERGIQW